MAYCEESDLTQGDFAPPRGVTVQSIIDKAAVEMDSILGQRYVTPIELSPTLASAKADRAKLNIINAYLATGNLILASGAGGEDGNLHAYAWYCVKKAMALLKEIVDGKVPLENVPELTDRKDAGENGMLVLNKDLISHVDDFYNGASPSTLPSSQVPYLAPAYPYGFPGCPGW